MNVWMSIQEFVMDLLGNDNLEVQNWDMDIQNRIFVRLQDWHQHETN